MAEINKVKIVVIAINIVLFFLLLTKVIIPPHDIYKNACTFYYYVIILSFKTNKKIIMKELYSFIIIFLFVTLMEQLILKFLHQFYKKYLISYNLP